MSNLKEISSYGLKKTEENPRTVKYQRAQDKISNLTSKSKIAKKSNKSNKSFIIVMFIIITLAATIILYKFGILQKIIDYLMQITKSIQSKGESKIDTITYLTKIGQKHKTLVQIT